MKFLSSFLVFTLFFCTLVLGQNAENNSPKKPLQLPLIGGLIFQNFALPWKDLGSNFTHPGIMLGTEISYNKKQNLLQQFTGGYYFNKEMGNGFQLYTQFVYRPKLTKFIHPEAKIGAGWLRTYHPVQSYKFQNNEWKKVGGGKSQLIVPIGFSLVYNNEKQTRISSPFISYQILPTIGYNAIVPVSFYTQWQIGTKINLKK